MIRILGFILIVSGASCVGIMQAASVRRTYRLYEDLRFAAVWLAGEIRTTLAPLEQAFRGVSLVVNDPLSGLFSSLSQAIANDPGCSTLSAATRYFMSDQSVPAPLRDIIYDLLRMLGRQDVLAQEKALELTVARAEALLQQMDKEKTDRCRSYGTLGICAGLALGVILI